MSDRGIAKSVVDQVAEAISTEIIHGVLKPGDDLNSVDLATRFKSSRTPVREALLLLERQGLVEIPPRRRPRVASITFEEVRDVYAVRANLHAMVFQLLAEHATADQINRLEEAFLPMTGAFERSDAEAYFWANVQFHDVAAELCGNRTLKRVLDPLRLRTLQLRRLSLAQPGRIFASHADHRRTIDACVARDAALAEALMKSIIMAALRALEASGFVETSAPRTRRTTHRRA